MPYTTDADSSSTLSWGVLGGALAAVGFLASQKAIFHAKEEQGNVDEQIEDLESVDGVQEVGEDENRETLLQKTILALAESRTATTSKANELLALERAIEQE